MSIHIHLERFEGPLGLLLYLIRQEEMDIFDINIHQITRQYLEYIKTMRKLDLEIAGEFVAMAATLIHIKSRMLLPQYDGEGEEGAVPEDPRKELVQKLVEYQKIQELSKQLYERPLLGRDVFSRGARENLASTADSEIVTEENPLFSLIAAYRYALKHMKKTIHRVLGDLQSISTRIMEMKDRLVVGQRVGFQTLITAEGEMLPNQVLVTFLSLLELAKMNFVSLFQADTFTEIHVEAKKVIDHDIVSQVENYENVDAGAKADALMTSAQLSLDEYVETEEEVAVGNENVEIEAATDEEILAEETRMMIAEAPEVAAETLETVAAAEVVAPSSVEVTTAAQDAANAMNMFLDTEMPAMIEDTPAEIEQTLTIAEIVETPELVAAPVEVETVVEVAATEQTPAEELPPVMNEEIHGEEKTEEI